MRKFIMYLAMCSQIVFPQTSVRGQVEIRRISSARVESSWSSLTDTAQVVLPWNVPEFKGGVKDLFRRGDPVQVYLGYNGNLSLEFEGYLSRLSATIPVTLYLEDEMFALKSIPVNKSYRSVGLKQLIQDIAPGYKTDVADMELGAVRLEKTTVAATLELLKGKGIYSYFKGKHLVVGKIYRDDAGEKAERFSFSRNILDDKNLEYVLTEDNPVRVTAYSLLPGGDMLEVTLGDKEGVESRMAHYGIQDRKKLQQLAELDLKRLKVDGYRGSFVASGIPQVHHGQRVEIVDETYGDRSGQYYVDATVVTFSDQPSLRREITLGRRCA